MAQASIGPGMAIFTRYSQIVEPDGSPLSVRTALSLINQILDEVQSEQEGDFDADTRFAIQWFSQYGHAVQPFGEADNLSRAKGTSVEGLARSGILEAKAGKVRLLPREELDKDWDPATDSRLTVWEATQHLIRVLENDGEEAASVLQKQLNTKDSLGETARELAYRLYTICEKNKWADLARSYNGLVASWNDMSRIVSGVKPVTQKSFDLDDEEE
jgi:putative DNA methylase